MMQLAKAGIKIRNLQVFRELLKTSSERVAAKVLKITQPAVSQQIRQLEAAIGFPLFVREVNRITPTDRAWELLRAIDDAFAGIDRLDNSILSLRSDDRRIIGIAAPGVFCLETLPTAVSALRKRNKSYAVRISAGSYQQTAEHILSGRADIGIGRLPLDERVFDWTPIGTANNVCLFHSGHRFARKSLVTSRDLIGEPIIDIEPQYSAHQMNINALRYIGVEPDIAVEYDASGSDFGFVIAGIGVSITNSIVVNEYRRSGLEFRRFEPGAIYHYVVFWQKDRALVGGLLCIVEELIAAFVGASWPK